MNTPVAFPPMTSNLSDNTIGLMVVSNVFSDWFVCLKTYIDFITITIII